MTVGNETLMVTGTLFSVVDTTIFATNHSPTLNYLIYKVAVTGDDLLVWEVNRSKLIEDVNTNVLAGQYYPENDMGPEES